MRQIDLSAEVAGQDTVDVKAAQGVSGGVSGGTVAARAAAGKLYESRSACATAQRRC